MRVVLALWIVLSVTALVRAQPDDAPDAPSETSEADRLFDEGRALAKERRYAEACERFARSYEIDPSLGTQLNLADCKEVLGEHREALRLFRDAAEQADRAGDTSRATFARKRASVVESRLAIVVVRIAQPVPGLVVTVEGRNVETAGEIREVVGPGEIEVVTSAPGHAPFRSVVNAAAAATVEVNVPALAAATEPSTGPRDRRRVRTAIILGAAGGVAMLTAAVLTVKARGDFTSIADGPNCVDMPAGLACNDTGQRGIDDAQRLADIGTGFVVAGGALVIASAILYVTAPRSGTTITPAVSDTTVGAVLTHSF